MNIQTIQWNSGTILAIKTGTYTLRWIRKQKNLTLFHFILARSWDFSKKKGMWWHHQRIEFKTPNLKGKNFLKLLNNALSDTEPSYSKGGPWIENFRFSNLLCARATQTITNHAPIGEYWLHFFPREEFSCPCRLYPIEIRHHIL